MSTKPPQTWTTTLELFSELAELSDDIWKSKKGSYVTIEDYHIEELSQRCWQLKWGLELIETYYFSWNTSGRPDKPEYTPPDLSVLSSEEFHKIFWTGMKKTEYLCDAFYMTAFRIYDILKRYKQLKFEARGVVLVRNLLIIHPEQRDGSMRFAFSGIGDFPGPKYKGRYIPGNKPNFIDPGLLINAWEFGLNLLQKLKNYQINGYESLTAIK